MGDHAEQEYLKPYRRAVEQFGAGFKATLWGSRDAQTLRFDVMIDVARFEGCVILDAGCGQGDFAARLLERSVAFKRYVGVDALEQMIEAARVRELSRCEFLCADLLVDPAIVAGQHPDYVCISGTLNTMDESAARRLVASSFDAAARGVAFNFLSSRPHRCWEGKDLTPARRFDPLRWLDFSLSLSSRVSFTQAYLYGHDATIVILHDDEAVA